MKMKVSLKNSVINETEKIVQKSKISYELNRNSFFNLFYGNTLAIVNESFALPTECLRLENFVEDIGFGQYRNVSPQINRIGVTQFEHSVLQKSNYFEQAEKVKSLFNDVCDAAFDPLERLIHLIERKTGIKIQRAYETDGRLYHAGNFRKIEKGTPVHIDYAAVEAKGWSIDRVTHQLALNFYIQVPKQGGELVIYEKQWSPTDLNFRDPKSSYGYSNEVIDGIKANILLPKIGQAIIFNSRQFHKVEESSSRRMTFSCAIGLTDDEQIWIWS
jgi:hypothetical protein